MGFGVNKILKKIIENSYYREKQKTIEAFSYEGGNG